MWRKTLQYTTGNRRKTLLHLSRSYHWAKSWLNLVSQCNRVLLACTLTFQFLEHVSSLFINWVIFYFFSIESPIRSYGGYCIQPKSGDCNPKENMTTLSHSLIFKRADTNCSADYMNFLFDADGMIYHKCSGKIVCPEGECHQFLIKVIFASL